MYRIVIVLLLGTGALCMLNQDTNEEVLKHDVTEEIPVSSEPFVQNEKLSEGVSVKQETPPKKAPVTLDRKQIDLLAEKVIRIHEVDLESSDEENLNNIAKLRNLVTNVEKDLNAKLKLSLEKKKLNLNKQNEVKDSIPPESSDSVQEKNEEDVPQNDNRDNANEEIVNTPNDINENVNTVNNLEENTKTVSEIEKRTSENKSDNDDELSNNLEDVKTDKNEDINTETDSNNISENQSNQQETEETTRGENGQNNSDEINIIPPEGKSDVKPEAEQSINTNEYVLDKNVEKGDESTIETVTVQKVKNATEDPVVEENVDETKTEKQTEEGHTENEDDETETREANSSINETGNAEIVEEESDSEKYIKEDEIIGSCSLGEDCDQTDNGHKYSEDYNTEKIQEENLEGIMEESYLRSIMKYLTSILN